MGWQCFFPLDLPSIACSLCSFRGIVHRDSLPAPSPAAVVGGCVMPHTEAHSPAGKNKAAAGTKHERDGSACSFQPGRTRAACCSCRSCRSCRCAIPRKTEPLAPAAAQSNSAIYPVLFLIYRNSLQIPSHSIILCSFKTIPSISIVICIFTITHHHNYHLHQIISYRLVSPTLLIVDMAK